MAFLAPFVEVVDLIIAAEEAAEGAVAVARTVAGVTVAGATGGIVGASVGAATMPHDQNGSTMTTQTQGNPRAGLPDDLPPAKRARKGPHGVFTCSSSCLLLN